MYNFGKQTKEKARQQKQIDKASKRMAAKQQKALMETSDSKADAEIGNPGLGEDGVKNTA
jgi:hypothetical protein